MEQISKTFSYIIFSLRNARARRNLYSGSFLLGGIGVFCTNSVNFLAFWAMLSFFKGHAALSPVEFSLLYGLSFMSVALARVASAGFDVMVNSSQNGSLDAWLTRPLPLALQILCHDFLLRLVIPLLLWAGITVALVLFGIESVNSYLLWVLPFHVLALALLLYSMQGLGYLLSFWIPRFSAAGDMIDPMVDLTSKIPLDGAQLGPGFASVLVGVANAFGFYYVYTLVGKGSLQSFYVMELGLLTLAAMAWLGYNFILKLGLQHYSSGTAADA